ncbi:hypothetical protein GCM10009118_07860 [Wandonia haliotis]|uniref:Uncharacterized protein n=1 Tax=Wandonia haliotis TaxID=574963 RepID=A0ABP3XY57_9FLAO
MIYYKFTDLLVFLEECKDEEFGPIIEITRTLNDFSLTEEDRINYILAILRYHGLHESMPLVDNSEKKKLLQPPIFKNTKNPIQLFDITFENGKIDFWQNLN